MPKVQKKLNLMVDLEFKNCGRIIVAPKENIYAFSCIHCNSLYTQMRGFVRHLNQVHTVIFGESGIELTKVQKSESAQKPERVYTVEELLGTEDEQASEELEQQQTAGEADVDAFETVIAITSDEDEELQLEIEEILAGATEQRENMEDHIEVLKLKDALKAGKVVGEEEEYLHTENKRTEMYQVITPEKNLVVHVEVVESVSNELEIPQQKEIGLDAKELECCEPIETIAPQVVEYEPLQEFTFTGVEQDLEQPATVAIHTTPLKSLTDKRRVVVQLNEKQQVINYSFTENENMNAQDVKMLPNDVPQRSTLDRGHNVLASIENLRSHTACDVKTLENLRILAPISSAISALTMRKQFSAETTPNKLNIENRMLDNAVCVQQNLEDSSSIVNNAQQKDATKSQVPIAVVQANNFCEISKLDDSNQINCVIDKEKLEVPLRKRILKSSDNFVDHSPKRCRVEKTEAKENNSSPILLNISNELEPKAVTNLTENGFEFLQDGVAILSFNVTDVEQEKMKVVNLSEQKTPAINGTDRTYITNDTHNQYKILIKIKQETSSSGETSPEKKKLHTETSKQSVSDINIQQKLTETELNKQEVAYHQDFETLSKVGLHFILDPILANTLTLQEIQEIHDKASKFASIFINFKYIWYTKDSGKCSQQLEKEFTQLTTKTNELFTTQLSINQMIRIVNLIFLWHRRCHKQKMCAPKSVWYYMQIFLFLPKSGYRIFYCEHCTKNFRYEIKYNKHRQCHSKLFAGFYCQYCHSDFFCWKSLKTHESLCKSHNCFECGFQCKNTNQFKEHVHNKHKKYNDCDESCAQHNSTTT